MSWIRSAVVVAVIAGAGAGGSQADVHRTPRPVHARIVTQPSVEVATPTSAIIRWTANTAGGTAKHFGIVRYGADPRQLDRVAMSPVKWSSARAPIVTYRVRIDGLAPRTTYYYVVDAAQADRKPLGLASPIEELTTTAAAP